MPGLPLHHQLPESTQTKSIKLVMPSNHLILCCPLLVLPPIFPTIRVFFNESVLCNRWPKYWSFSFSIPSNEHPGLISFMIDWFDFLVVQRTLKSLLQYHSSKASILRCSALFIVQLLHPYITTGKAIALIRQTFVGKVMSLLFNILFMLVIVFLPRGKHLLISWLQSKSVVILEPPKIKSLIVSSSICHKVMGVDAMIFVFCMLNFGLPCSSAGKESACNTGDLGSIPGLGRSPGKGKGLPTPVFWPGEFHGLYSPWGRKELDTTEQLSLHYTLT